ncbi:MAG: VanZ family protein [Thermodesulfobacteriota bacterium]|nr:VanZ family protein [Thermodesulfobacteriota bacterium]
MFVPFFPLAFVDFCFFVLFGLVLSMLLNRESCILVYTHILLLAGATELAQFYIDGRSPLILDFVIDAFGGLFGILLMKFFSMSMNTKKLRSPA